MTGKSGRPVPCCSGPMRCMSRLKFVAILAIMAAAAWFAWNQQAEIARLTGELSAARQALSDRIAAEDRKVIEAFELGREQTARELQKQKEVLDALEAENESAAGRLAAARERMRREFAAAARGPGGADVPAADHQACDADNAYRARVLEAAGVLADGVLQVGADADQAARNFNALIATEEAREPEPK